MIIKTKRLKELWLNSTTDERVYLEKAFPEIDFNTETICNQLTFHRDSNSDYCCICSKPTGAQIVSISPSNRTLTIQPDSLYRLGYKIQVYKPNAGGTEEWGYEELKFNL